MDIDFLEFDSFAKSHKNSDLHQSSAWARLKEKTGRSIEILGVGDGKKLTGAALLLYKRLGGSKYNICYLIRGPVVGWDDRESVDAILDAIIEAAKKNNSIFIRMLPKFLEDKTQYKEILEKHGFKHRGYSFGVQSDIQPRHHMVTDITRDEKALLNSFQSRTKTSVRKSLKNGLDFIEANDKVEIFYNLFKETSQRDGFVICDMDYIQTIIDSFGDNAKIFLVKLDEKKAQEKLRKDLANKTKELSKIEAKNEDGKRDIQIEELKNSIENTNNLLENIGRLAKERPEGIYLSGMLYLQNGRDAFYFFGASSDDLRELMPNYFMQYKAMLYAKDEGCSLYDFGGVSGLEGKDNDPEPGLYEFKKRWGSEKISLIGEFDLVLKPFQKNLYDMTWKLKDHISKIKNKIKGMNSTSYYE